MAIRKVIFAQITGKKLLLVIKGEPITQRRNADRTAVTADNGELRRGPPNLETSVALMVGRT